MTSEPAVGSDALNQTWIEVAMPRRRGRQEVVSPSVAN